MTRMATMILSAMALVGCGENLLTEDTTYVVRDERLVEVVAECLADLQPHIPFALSVQVGGRGRGSFYGVDVADHIEHGASAKEPAGRTYYDPRVVVINENTLGTDWIKVTVCHEIGHSVGLTHEDCPDGLMGPDESISEVTECEADRLRELYR